MSASRPKLLDLFSGAGGAARGYQLAGFRVTGVDVRPQPRYVGEAFVQGDALEYLAEHGREYDAIHASPPCQLHSNAQRIRGNAHAELIGPTRQALIASGRPYVIENVPGAPLRDPVSLIGTVFDLGTVRERLFECSFPVPFMLALVPGARHTKMGRRVKPGTYMHVVGNFAGIEQAQRAMEIDWMTQRELAQAIPPAYTHYLGTELRRYLDG